ATLQERYAAIKAQYPGEGRRRWHQRVAQEFWSSLPTNAGDPPNDEQLDSELSHFMQDDDALDPFLEGEELGVLIRTDYSNEDAWNTFYGKFKEAEKDIIDSMKESQAVDSATLAEGSSSSRTQDDVKMESADDDADDSDDTSDELPSSVIKVLNPGNAQERALIEGISNLTALRLLNDVDIRPSPTLPAETKRISPQNRLVDQNGWQEIYTGKNVWIYDARSNTDECVRVVNQAGDFYGTATGDSWRARGSHICELQFNMAYMGMKIDFGGLDRWDYEERKRNLIEAGV
ncbi:hypothetical protein BDQ12DRAFT_594067, partial [Crucibulum laeve]